MIVMSSMIDWLIGLRILTKQQNKTIQIDIFRRTRESKILEFCSGPHQQQQQQQQIVGGAGPAARAARKAACSCRVVAPRRLVCEQLGLQRLRGRVCRLPRSSPSRFFNAASCILLKILFILCLHVVIVCVVMTIVRYRFSGGNSVIHSKKTDADRNQYCGYS